MKILSLAGVRDALIVAPHADDETIGGHGLILRLRRGGARVRVLIVTDGAASHPNSASWLRARLVRARRDEVRRAMRALGVGAGDVAFLGLPDSGSAPVAASHRRMLARTIAHARSARLLVLPASDDDHADDRMVAAIAARVPMRARRIAYPVWPAGLRT